MFPAETEPFRQPTGQPQCCPPRPLTFFRGDTIQLKGQIFQALQAPGSYRLGWFTPTEIPTPPPGFGPANIAGFSLWFTLKLETQDPDGSAVAQVTTGGGQVTLTAPASGIFQLVVPPTATYGNPDDDVAMVWDVQLEDLSGNIATAGKGKAVETADVTRAISASPGVAPIPFAASYLSMLTVANTGVFATLPAGSFADGSIAYVPGSAGALGSYFALLSQSTTAVDGVKTFAASPAGRWQKLSLVLA